MEFLRYAGPVITHQEFHKISDAFSGQHHLTTGFIVVLDGIVDEVPQYLLELSAGSDHHREFAFNTHLDVRGGT